MSDVVMFIAAALAVASVFGLGIYSIVDGRRLERENDRRLAEWHAAIAAAKARGEVPPGPPLRLVRPIGRIQ